ncbi:MAG TPA: DUF5695 domain-containing protein [Pyrinomonadaceae bacterium]|jgi:hypothetical protein|nr:DUF5695 domain-containing protein [Pyrinomonadaceae bacterium]
MSNRFAPAKAQRRKAKSQRFKTAVLLCVFLCAFAPLRGKPFLKQDDKQLFDIKFDRGAIASLQRSDDRVKTDYVQPGRRLGNVFIRYRGKDGAWQSADTEAFANNGLGTFAASADGRTYTADYEIRYAPSNSNTAPATTQTAAPILGVQIKFMLEGPAVLWTLTIRNLGNAAREIDDLAIPLPIARTVQGETNRQTINILKHSFISGHNSYIFWMRSNNIGPYLMLTPLTNTKLEYWEAPRGPSTASGPTQLPSQAGYRVYIHSAAAGTEARAQGTRWRQPNTHFMLAPKGEPGDSRSHSFKLHWADDYDAVRQLLVDEGLIDVSVVPGMTIPSDLFARFALRTKQPIRAIDAEFPKETQISSLGVKNDLRFYEVHFKKLGENRLTVRYGNDQHMFLEFFSTEPLETLIKKRAAFLTRSQHRDPSKWYNGLITDWNMESQVLLSPDNYDRIQSWRIYMLTCDDPGLGKPAYLASKNAEYPVQAEVEALDYYIKNFVWGGLQQTTSEPYPYGIYGIPDWKTNRESVDPGRNGKRHLWRIYDYPHILVMYHAMYRVAKNFPGIKTALPATEYLRRAYGTALALFTVPMQIERWSAYRTGLYNELVIVSLLSDLEAAGLSAEAQTLRAHWEQKVKTFVSGQVNLFQSEYAFDSTGFEATHALAKYALDHADHPGENKTGIPFENAQAFMEKQLASNIFCRGWLEPAYYLLGSDYRAGGGNSFTLSYMSQMGGWSVLDYALNYAKEPDWYLRLGYASYLSAWALMNTGTPESNYGYWYSGKENDGAAGGGFEPAPYGQTWLNQPHHRGAWYYSSEVDLGYSGALRTATTVLADDPIFGRFCFGGLWSRTPAGIEVVPKDGVRRRFHVSFNGGRRLHMVLATDRFASSHPIVLKEDLSEIRFRLESDNSSKHVTSLSLSGMKPGSYRLREGNKTIATWSIKEREEIKVEFPVASDIRSRVFVISQLFLAKGAPMTP